MIKKLKKIDEHRLHYYVDVYGYGGKLITKEKHIGVPPHIEGIKEGCTSLSGDLSNISGNASKLTGRVDPELKGIIREKVFGDVSNVKGDIRGISEINFSNISGDVSRLHGSFCNIYGEVSEHLEIWQDSKWQTLYICGDVSNIYGQ